MEWTSVKKGWVYQRKKHLIFPTSWSPKYLVLYSGPIPALAVYEQRSDAMPPYAPLLHIEVTEPEMVQVAPVSGASSLTTGGKFWQAVGSRKASIVSTLSRKASFREVSLATVSDKDSKSYKERMLEDQGFVVTRANSAGSSSIKLVFATESREERDSWIAEISRVIEMVQRKNQPVQVVQEVVSVVQFTNRSASQDLSIVRNPFISQTF